MARVVAAGGQSFDVWPEMLGSVKIGCRYNVEVKDRVFQGRTYQSITKATPYAESNGAMTAAVQARTNGNGHLDPDAERIFVQGIVQAYIKSGRCANPAELTQTINTLREVWRRTFGAAGASLP